MIIPEFLMSGLKDPVFRCHIHFEGALLLLQWRAERSRDSELDKSFLTFFSHICVRINPWATHSQRSADISI
jgi:hypothetical protein